MSVKPPSTRRRAFILCSIGLVYFINVFALSSINIAIPAIADEFKVSALLLNWTGMIFLVSMMMFTLPIAKLANGIGRRTIFIMGMIVFIVSSVISVVADSIYMVLAIRFFQGVGSAALFSSGLAIIAAIYPEGEKAGAIGIINTMVYTGMTLGPMLGGWILQLYNWRILMALPAIVVLLSLFAFMVSVNQNRRTLAESIDWIGTTIWSLALWVIFLSISLPISMLTLVGLTLGIGLLIVFVKQQNRSNNPLVNLERLKKNKLFNRSILASICSYAGNYSLIFLLSLYLQYIIQLDSLQAGKILAVQALLMALLSSMVGKLSNRFGTANMAISGCVFMVLAYFVLSRLTMESSVMIVITGLILNGFGFGLFSAPNNTIAMEAVPAERLNIGSALVNLARNIGSTMGMAVVLLLTSFYLGRAVINESNLPDLMKLIQTAMFISMAFSLIACYFSYSRKNMQ